VFQSLGTGSAQSGVGPSTNRLRTALVSGNRPNVTTTVDFPLALNVTGMVNGWGLDIGRLGHGVVCCRELRTGRPPVLATLGMARSVNWLRRECKVSRTQVS